ncbi:hypothetical protein DOY81_007252 [Sarcophaga bullata]|nr:hypothetical protein DOY81_007252 [Sarcophaga bullata]
MSEKTLRAARDAHLVMGDLQKHLQEYNVTPHVYSSSISQCTLPRHSNHHLWSNYNNVLTGIHHLQPIPSMHYQQSLSVASNISQLPQHSGAQASATTSNIISTSNISSVSGRALCLQQGGTQQLQRARVCVAMGNSGIHTVDQSCLSDEEGTTETPLMMKRESTV